MTGSGIETGDIPTRHLRANAHVTQTGNHHQKSSLSLSLISEKKEICMTAAPQLIPVHTTPKLMKQET
jgi:hypothetical protein